MKRLDFVLKSLAQWLLLGIGVLQPMPMEAQLFAYVANSQGQDVTVIDTKQLSRSLLALATTLRASLPRQTERLFTWSIAPTQTCR